MEKRQLVTRTAALAAAGVILTGGGALAATWQSAVGAEETGAGASPSSSPDKPKKPVDPTAKKFLAETIDATTKYKDSGAAESAGYDVDKAVEKRAGNAKGKVTYVSVVNKKLLADDKTADPKAPEVLVYRRDKEGKLALAGVAFRVTPKQAVGEGQKLDLPAPAGKLTRWMVKGEKQPPTMHVWFVDDTKTRKAYQANPPKKASEKYLSEHS